MAAFYPVMLNLEGRVCVVVGGGEVAVRKVQSLLDVGARIWVISPQLHLKLAALAESGQIAVHQTAYKSGMLAELEPLLVFAATSDAALNQQIVNEARSIGALANAVNAQGEHDFMNMATIERGSVRIGVFSGGASPELVSHIREQISDLIGVEYGTLAAWLGEARTAVQDKIASQPERAALWRRVMESSILDTLREGDIESARQAFEQIIQETVDRPL